jgi:hypothetical protein
VVVVVVVMVVMMMMIMVVDVSCVCVDGGGVTSQQRHASYVWVVVGCGGLKRGFFTHIPAAATSATYWDSGPQPIAIFTPFALLMSPTTASAAGPPLTPWSLKHASVVLPVHANSTVGARANTAYLRVVCVRRVSVCQWKSVIRADSCDSHEWYLGIVCD